MEMRSVISGLGSKARFDGYVGFIKPKKDLDLGIH